jgi:hypothetical protein
MSERTLQNAIINLLRLNGWFAYSQDTKGTFDPTTGRFRANPSRVTGVSDVLAIKKGRVLFIEVKQPKGKQTPNQIEFKRQIEEHGGEYYVARSLEDAQVMIEYKENTGTYGC